MKVPRIVNAMNYIDDDLVSGAETYQPKKKKNIWVKWSAVAACLCLTALGAFSIRNFNSNPAMPDLQKICIPELTAGGMGFEGYLYYNASELDNDNPWNENTKLETLPVYINKAYDASGAGIPKGFTEEEMLSILDSATAALGIEVLSTEIFTEPEEDGRPLPTEIQAETNNGTVSVLADGDIVYSLPDDGLTLPDAYSFTFGNTTDSEAYQTIAYLSDVYSELLDMKNPVAVSWGDYDIYGEYHRRYGVYDACGNDVEQLLNYNLCEVSFIPADANGKLFIIRISNALRAAEKVGNYPIISAKEAEQRLLAGTYQTNVPYTMPGKEYIAKVELVYRTGRLEEMLIPYYRFYVLLLEEARDNGLQTYGAYYVPAITDNYITVSSK